MPQRNGLLSTDTGSGFWPYSNRSTPRDPTILQQRIGQGLPFRKRHSRAGAAPIEETALLITRTGARLGRGSGGDLAAGELVPMEPDGITVNVVTSACSRVFTEVN